MGNARLGGWKPNSSTGKADMKVFNASGTERTVYDEDGNLYQGGTKVTATAAQINGASTPLTSPVMTTPQINDTTADHQYVVAVSELTADRTVTLPLLTGNDEFAFKAHTQTLTNKTLTSPKLNEDVAVTATATQVNRAKVAEQTVLFTEAGEGTYTGTISLPAGSIIQDIIVHAIALWDAATSAALIVGDATDPNGFFDAVDLKATDLLAAESISFAHTGGKEGADLDDPAAGAHVRRRYAAAARDIVGVVTSVGAGTAGRTLMTVVYVVPTSIAAVKS